MYVPPSRNLILILTRTQITCHGGNGIAIGSLGQYLEDSSVINVVVKDANILTYNDDMENGAYIKTWVGALVPQVRLHYKPIY